MIGILLLIGPIATAWNLMWRLAADHKRSRVGYAFLGVGAYIVSYFAFAVVLGIIFAITGQSLQLADDFLLNLSGVIFGLLCVWLMHYLLKRSWEKKRAPEGESQLLDDLNDHFQ